MMISKTFHKDGRAAGPGNPQTNADDLKKKKEKKKTPTLTRKWGFKIRVYGLYPEVFRDVWNYLLVFDEVLGGFG